MNKKVVNLHRIFVSPFPHGRGKVLSRQSTLFLLEMSKDFCVYIFRGHLMIGVLPLNTTGYSSYILVQIAIYIII